MSEKQDVELKGLVSTIQSGAGYDEGHYDEITPEPCAMVIFGASGDLAQRKLIPALYRLTVNKLISRNFFIVGAARKDLTDDFFRKEMESSVRASGTYEEESWNEFSKRLFYKQLDYANEDAFCEVRKFMAVKEKEYGTRGNRIFYLSTPPSVYADIAERIASSGLSDKKGWSRLVIEKPFGRDLKSALELNRLIHRSFSEHQIYRIDHYLGKETVQNIMMLRFANSIFEPLWNRRYIDHIQVTVAETLGVEKRAGYYEQSGILRDMFQNHMLQLLALAAMEPPSIYEPELVRDERVKVLRALRPLTAETVHDSVVVGQYVSGMVDGKYVGAYRDEPGVARDSRVPTFAALKLNIDNWRWQDVPFYLRSGKRMSQRFSEVAIQFKSVPHFLFKKALGSEIGPNALILRMHPDERIQLKFHTKNPGSKVSLRNVVMDFPYLEGYKGINLDAYERVLMDCMLGDKMLFVRSDGIELSWAYLSPLIEYMESHVKGGSGLNFYEAGSLGPVESDAMMGKDGRWWRNYV